MGNVIDSNVPIRYYDKPAYSKEDYKALRAYNREVFWLDPEWYWSNQVDYEINYEAKIGGVVYYFNDFYNGIMWIKKHYKAPIRKFFSFSEIYSLGYKLPKEIEYFVKYTSDDYRSKSQYVSKDNKFDYTYGDFGRDVIDIKYGNSREIKEIIMTLL